MSQACLLLRPTESLISAFSSSAAASEWFAENRIAASCAVGSAPEWYSSEPSRPVARASGRMLPVLPPIAGVVAMGKV